MKNSSKSVWEVSRSNGVNWSKRVIWKPRNWWRRTNNRNSNTACKISSSGLVRYVLSVNNTTFWFSSLIYGLCAKLCFSGTWLDWWLIDKNIIFLCRRFIFASRLVLYFYACAIENTDISGLCVSKSRGLRTDHKRMKKIET